MYGFSTLIKSVALWCFFIIAAFTPVTSNSNPIIEYLYSIAILNGISTKCSDLTQIRQEEVMANIESSISLLHSFTQDEIINRDQANFIVNKVYKFCLANPNNMLLQSLKELKLIDIGSPGFSSSPSGIENNNGVYSNQNQQKRSEIEKNNGVYSNQNQQKRPNQGVRGLRNQNIKPKNDSPIIFQ